MAPAVYSATITDNNGCHTYTTVNITQPNILVLVPSPVQTICYGNVAAIYGQASGGNPYSYTLTNLTTNTSTTATTANGINSTPTLSSTTQYTVIVVDVNGCANGPQNILVNVRPQLLATAGSFTVCDRDMVALTPSITSQGNGGPYTYQWSNASIGATSTVIASYANNPNSYNVMIEDGCTIPGATANFNIIVNPLPQFTFTPAGAKGCAPLAVTFTGTSTSPDYDPSNDIFYWNFGGDQNGGGPIPGNPIFHI